MMSFLAAQRSDRFSAMVVGGAPTDAAAELKARPDMESVFRTWVPGFESDRSTALTKRSVIRWAGDLPPQLPILILHGTQDSRVSPMSALSLATRLQELNHPYQLVMFHDGEHTLERYEAEVQRETTAWFKEFLGPVDKAGRGLER